MSGGGLAAAESAASQERANKGVGSAVQSCPLKRAALEVVVVDEDGQPVSKTAVELRNQVGQALYASTLRNGRVRFDGLSEEPYTLNLHELDAALWSLESDEALAGPAAQSHGDAPWGDSAEQAPGPRTHVVKQGECLFKPADRFGFLPETIAEHPDNARLKEARRTLGILAPGDVVTIPARMSGAAPVQVGRRFRVVRKTVAVTLNLRFLDEYEKPRAGVPYLLSVKTIDGKLVADCKGKTNTDGVLAERVPPSAYVAEICLGEGVDMEIHDIDIGHVDPIETVRGVQTRLESLGYDCGNDARGESGPGTKAALAGFQEDHQLDVTGSIDDKTRSKLTELFLA